MDRFGEDVFESETRRLSKPTAEDVERWAEIADNCEAVVPTGNVPPEYDCFSPRLLNI